MRKYSTSVAIKEMQIKQQCNTIFILSDLQILLSFFSYFHSFILGKDGYKQTLTHPSRSVHTLKTFWRVIWLNASKALENVHLFHLSILPLNESSKNNQGTALKYRHQDVHHSVFIIEKIGKKLNLNNRLKWISSILWVHIYLFVLKCWYRFWYICKQWSSLYRTVGDFFVSVF